MIYPQTILTVADNTGAKKIMCIRILGGNQKYAKMDCYWQTKGVSKKIRGKICLRILSKTSL